jgi:outer membrane protein TolC
MRRSARGRFGPIVRVEANVLRWSSPFALPIDIPVPAPLGPLNVPPIPVRDATTAQVSATVVQPLTGLWTVYEGHRAQSLGEDAAHHQERATRHDVVLAVADAYLQALEAERMTALAADQVRTIEAHVERARRFLVGELIARNDVLAAEVRLAEARARQLQAQGGARLARANLAFQIGLPANEDVWPEELPAPSVAATTARNGAPPGGGSENRPELAAVRARVEQARAGVRVATAQMLPEVNAIFRMEHVEGVYFQPRNAWFVGAQLSWNIWDWGSSYYAIDAARAQARQVEAAETRAEEGLRLEAMQAEIELDTATAQLRVAHTTVTQAEENLEIVERRFEQQAATSTDVLDAQALLQATRMREASAEYEVLRARVRSRRTQGLDPVVIAGGAR